MRRPGIETAETQQANLPTGHAFRQESEAGRWLWSDWTVPGSPRLSTGIRLRLGDILETVTVRETYSEKSISAAWRSAWGVKESFMPGRAAPG